MASQSSIDPEKGLVIARTGTHRPADTSDSADSDTPSDPAPDALDRTATAGAASTASGPDFIPPDGGLVAWIQVLAGALINCMCWGYPATFGVYQLYYRDTWPELSSAQISWIGSMQTFLTFFLCTVSGRLADAGHCRTTILGGGALAVLGTFMTSLATQYWHAMLAQGICTGLGLGLMFMPALSVINSYFSTKKNFALALAAVGTSAGSVIFPAVVQYLIPQVGFSWAVRAQGFIVLAFTVLSTFLMRPRLKPRRSGPVVEWAAFREPAYVLFVMGVFFFFWALHFGFFYVNSYSRAVIGFSTTDSVQLLLIINAMGIPARPIVGIIADKVLGPMNTYIVCLLFLSVHFFAWIAVSSRPGMYAFSTFYGFMLGAAQGVFVGSLASMTPDPRKMGTRFGMVATLSAFATLAGPTTAGAIIDASGGRYTWAQVWGGMVIIVSALTVTASRCYRTGIKLKVKV